MKQNLELALEASKNRVWLSNVSNRKFLLDLADLSKEPYYQYLPYLNRSDGTPGWQWRFMAEADNWKGRIAFGANRIGKSKQGAYECVLAVTGRHPCRDFGNHGVAWIVGLDNAMVRDINRPLFEELLPKKFQHKFYKQDNMWLIKGDDVEWKLVFKSTEMGKDKFQGEKLSFIWFDEEPKYPDVMWQECETRLTDLGGIWWMTATPIRGTKWLKELSERDDVFSMNAGMAENPYIPELEINKLRRTLTEDEVAVRIDGDYIIFGGRPVFDRNILRKALELCKIAEYQTGTLKVDNKQSA